MAGILLFGTAFGYVEAAVVVYLRSIYGPWHAHYYPSAAADDLFPLLTLNQLQEMGPEHVTRLKVELVREFATLLMLAGAGLIVGRSLREWTAVFIASFGVWDVTFYITLKALLNWPASVFTWDLLFLLPVPWVGPVLAPVLVALPMTVFGLAVLWKEYKGVPVVFRKKRLSLIFFGGAIVFASFVADAVNTTQGGYPRPFQWLLFSLGEALWAGAFMSALIGTESSGRLGNYF